MRANLPPAARSQPSRAAINHGELGRASEHARGPEQAEREAAARLLWRLQPNANSGVSSSEDLSLAAFGDSEDTTGTADIDISSAEFDFVRSIRVWDIDWHQCTHENAAGEQECRRPRAKVRVGRYGFQGEFGWQPGDIELVNANDWIGWKTSPGPACAHEGSFRGIVVDWRDYDGKHDYEVVRY